jgi:hypothetical protein
MISAANRDENHFPEPERFSMGEHDPATAATAELAPERDPDKYLLFGVTNSNKYCWGSGRVAMPILEECVRAAGRLQGLRPVAGPRGEVQKLLVVTVGLPARFTRILPP